MFLDGSPPDAAPDIAVPDVYFDDYVPTFDPVHTFEYMEYNYGKVRVRDVRGAGYTWQPENREDHFIRLYAFPSDLSRFTMVREQGAGIRADGTVVEWGYSLDQIYSMERTHLDAPRDVPALSPARAVYDTGYRTYLIARDGQLWYWGAREDVDLNFHNPVDPYVVPPTRTSHLGPFVSISGEGGWACGLRTDGRVVCWGMNSSHTVAPEDHTDLHPPFPDTFIEGIHDAVELQCRIDDGCCVRLRNGTVWCWGDVQILLEPRPGTWTYRNPVQAPGIDRAVQISSVGASVCVLRDDQTVRCVGYGAAECPVAMTGAVSVLYTGGLVCVLRRDGTVWCWGRLDDYEHPCAGPRQIGL